MSKKTVIVSSTLALLLATVAILRFSGSTLFHRDAIIRWSAAYNEDPLFIAAVIKAESNFSRKARSARGAVGLMQLLPSTAQELALELKLEGAPTPDLENPETNIRLGTYYLSKLRREFKDDDAVLAAYNAGLKNAREWLKAGGKNKLDLQNIEFPETRKFVQDVSSSRKRLKTLRADLLFQ